MKAILFENVANAKNKIHADLIMKRGYKETKYEEIQFNEERIENKKFALITVTGSFDPKGKDGGCVLYTLEERVVLSI